MSSRSSPRRRGVAAALLTVLGACASTPPPIDAVAAADLALQQAETAQAATYAPGDLLRAREQLDNAKAEMRGENHANARRLAEQSAADSQLAIAKSRAAIAQVTAKAAQDSAGALRRQTAPGGAMSPGAAAPVRP
jgi:multidrug efflux pump subunit AcrA (membrane-fusion protein)